MAVTALVAGCGTKIATPLPDIKTKSAPPNGGPGPMTAAEQKRAIDELSPSATARSRPADRSHFHTLASQARCIWLSPPVIGETRDTSALASLSGHRRSARMGCVASPASLPEDLRSKLTPGMPATVLIATGERTLLKFLVGPLMDALSGTMRER